MKALACLGAALFMSTVCVRGEEAKWTIHEWGTFTSLQNEAGEAIGGINTDDEPVPRFVHRLANYLLLQPMEIPPSFCQGAPRCHPDVTMRLETPVIYFHPPTGSTASNVNVRVKFRGGWLTEYYPYAEPVADGLRPAGYSITNTGGAFTKFGPLRSDTESTLKWNDLKIGGTWPMTNTTAHVWTSPRAVKAASVLATNGECEKFLFYRGVAHIEAPLKISRSTKAGDLLFHSHLHDLPAREPLAIRKLWLVNIDRGGKVAYRSLPPISLDSDPNKTLLRTPSTFASWEFSSGNLNRLKSVLQTALVSEGLFPDEARALLNTWELSYFKSAGLRVFFLVPRAWTDFYLPLEQSLPGDVNRVMVGRIELITPEQRAGLAAMRGFSPRKVRAELGLLRIDYLASRAPNEFERLYHGEKRLSDYISIPKSYQTYLDLGRFRNALILDEARRRPTDGLKEFINLYGLAAYQPDAQIPSRPVATEPPRNRQL